MTYHVHILVKAALFSIECCHDLTWQNPIADRRGDDGGIMTNVTYFRSPECFLMSPLTAPTYSHLLPV